MDVPQGHKDLTSAGPTPYGAGEGVGSSGCLMAKETVGNVSGKSHVVWAESNQLDEFRMAGGPTCQAARRTSSLRNPRCSSSIDKFRLAPGNEDVKRVENDGLLGRGCH